MNTTKKKSNKKETKNEKSKSKSSQLEEKVEVDEAIKIQPTNELESKKDIRPRSESVSEKEKENMQKNEQEIKLNTDMNTLEDINKEEKLEDYMEEPSNLSIDNFFKYKYKKFYESNNKILEIFGKGKNLSTKFQNNDIQKESENSNKNKNKNDLIIPEEKNFKSIFLNLNLIYSLIKQNSNFFNFTKNILSKLEKENYFEDILLNIFYKISKKEIKIISEKEQNSENYTKKNLVFFILIFIKFKIKSKVNIFEFFGSNKLNEEIFGFIFDEITNNNLKDLDEFEREMVISFLILCYQNLEIKFVAAICLKYISFYLWIRLSPDTIKRQFLENEKYVEKWKILMKLDKKDKINTQKPSFYFNDLLDDFLFLLENENLKEINKHNMLNNIIDITDNNTDLEEKLFDYIKNSNNNNNSFIFFEKFIELLTDLVTQISTRKLILPFLKEKHFIERIKLTKFYLNNSENINIHTEQKEAKLLISTNTIINKEYNNNDNNYEYSFNVSQFMKLNNQKNFDAFKLFTKMVDNLKNFIDFDINENTNENITYDKIIMKHYEEINKMQALAYNLFPNKVSKFYLKCISSIDNRENLEILLDNLNDKELIDFFKKLNLLNLWHFDEDYYLNNKRLMIEIFVGKYEKKNILLDNIMDSPLYPNEELLFDNDLIPLNEKSHIDSKEDFLKILMLSQNAKDINNLKNQKETSKINNEKDSGEIDMNINERKTNNNFEEYIYRKHLLKKFYKNSTSNNYFVEKPYPIPKLNLQFLSNFDYLYRNFILFKFESSYEIRQDIIDVIERIFPVFNEKGNLKDFNGWSRMAVPIKSFKILSTKKPNIGKKFSEEIIADVEFSLEGIQPHIKNEWDRIKKHDIFFLITFQLKKNKEEDILIERKIEEDFEKFKSEENENKEYNNENEVNINNNNTNKNKKFGLEIVKLIRGCEVNFLYGNENNQLSELENINKKKPTGTHRRIQVILDGVQYNQDLKSTENNIDEIYSSFHLLIRRRPKENNFRAILETIRDLINESGTDGSTSTSTVIPPWLKNNFLGFGDPTTSDYRKLNNTSNSKFEFYDTFLNKQHFQESFLENDNIPNEFRNNINNNYIPKFLKLDLKNNRNHVYDILKKIDRLDTIKLLNVNVNENPEIYLRKNSIKFTKKQIEALVSGMHNGLTTIIGPPGTGKTDVAVQLVSLIYHNYPNQRTLILTHSNTALNDIFEKISKLDINERYLLRLGIGEKELADNIDKDFSRFGRINFMLEKRIELLNSVLKLARSINVFTHEEYTCENAVLFYEFHIISRIKEFKDKLFIKFGIDLKNDNTNINDKKNNDYNNNEILIFLKDKFPFNKYFAENLFKDSINNTNSSNSNSSNEKDINTININIFESDNSQNALKKTNTLIEYIEALFTEISEVRAFELLRNNIERGNYLLTKQAKVIAMTCTHAALKRREFIKLGFEYDNIIIEEAAQILEVETFIPLLLQNCDKYKESRLKRVILIGDDNQLPPIVKHATYKNYSKLDQSLFNRFVRTGCPYIKLDAQGRMRPIITDLIRWRYPNLIDLDFVKPVKLPSLPINPLEFSPFNFSNPGFVHEFQFINLPKGSDLAYEFCPVPHFYQNLAEAEYVVAVFMYMCIQGYNPENITILTTYNGQKALIKDIIKNKCAWNPIFKQPKKITTVDRYQGQQNDYVLLSLVRTKFTGYLRDIRRLIVSLSRAKLGIYVFGCWDLFANCSELKDTFDLFANKPLNLMININENMFTWPNLRRFGDEMMIINENNTLINKKYTTIKITDFKHMFIIINELMKIRSSFNIQGQGEILAK